MQINAPGRSSSTNAGTGTVPPTTYINQFDSSTYICKETASGFHRKLTSSNHRRIPPSERCTTRQATTVIIVVSHHGLHFSVQSFSLLLQQLKLADETVDGRLDRGFARVGEFWLVVPVSRSGRSRGVGLVSAAHDAGSWEWKECVVDALEGVGECVWILGARSIENISLQRFRGTNTCGTSRIHESLTRRRTTR